MKKRKQSGFSLMEMMVVLLIVAVVMAAAAPMVSRKMANSIANGGGSDSFWDQLNGVGRRSIGYNAQQVNNRDTVVIGERNPGFPANTDIPRFVVSSNSAGVPQIRLRENLLVNPRNLDINFSNESVLVTDSNTQSRQAVVVGFGAQGGTNTDSTAVGYQAQATAENSTALGHASRATADSATAVGRDAQATEANTTALGSNAQATASNAIAIGAGLKASGDDQIIIGSNSRTWGTGGVVLGTNAAGTGVIIGSDAGNSFSSGGGSGVIIGHGANPFSEFSRDRVVAIGEGVRYATNSTAVGHSANASGANSISIGYLATTGQMQNAIAIGAPNGTTSCSAGANSVAIGKGAVSGTSNSVAIGTATNAQAANAIAIGAPWGDSTTAGANSVAIGLNTKAIGSTSIAIGAGATATELRGIAIGQEAVAKKTNSVAIGNGATADHQNQIALGTSTTTVYIPGTLIVGKNAYLNTEDNDASTWVRCYSQGVNHPVKFGRFERDSNSNNSGASHVYDNRTLIWANDNTNSYTVVSDRRLKNVGESFKGGLSELKKLEFFHYTFKEDESKTPRVGVMAQDLQKVFPDAVIKGEDGFLRIRLEDMFYAVINAVKELDTRLTALTEQVKANIDLTAKLQKQVNEQSEQIAELKKQNAEFEKRLAKLEGINRRKKCSVEE